MLKKLWIYPVLFFVTQAFVLAYGFIFGGEFPLWLIGVFIFCNVIFLSCFYFKETKDKPINKLMTLFIVSVVLVFLCVFAYDEVNKLGKTEVDSYEATVIDTGSHRGKYYVTFYDPDGEEQTVERFDAMLLSPAWADDELIDYYGQTIKIIEYSGLFDVEYLVWIE